MRSLILFILLSTSATALTIDASWTLIKECPDRVLVDAPQILRVGENAMIEFDAGTAKSVRYTLLASDGSTLRSWRTVKQRASFTPSKNHAGERITVLAEALPDDCLPVAGNATISIEGAFATGKTRSWSTMTVVPWLLVALSTLLAAVLIWRR